MGQTLPKGKDVLKGFSVQFHLYNNAYKVVMQCAQLRGSPLRQLVPNILLLDKMLTILLCNDGGGVLLLPSHTGYPCNMWEGG